MQERGKGGRRRRGSERKKKKKKGEPRAGLEPATLRLRVSCSTDWANEATIIRIGWFILYYVQWRLNWKGFMRLCTFSIPASLFLIPSRFQSSSVSTSTIDSGNVNAISSSTPAESSPGITKTDAAITKTDIKAGESRRKRPSVSMNGGKMRILSRMWWKMSKMILL